MKAILAVAFVVSLSLSAEEVTLELSPAKTEIDYTVGTTLRPVHGTFKLKSGSIQFDTASGQASGDMVIDATSGSSGNEKRDTRMADFVLETKQYPDITFKPEHVDGTLGMDGDSRVVLKGALELHGDKHEIEAPVDAKVAGSDIDAVLHFPVPFVKWGLKDPSTLLLKFEKQVQIAVHVKGTLKPAGQ